MFQVSHSVFLDRSIINEIESHPSWLGNISGLKAERMLKKWKKPYLYVLRSGENAGETETDFYVSFILPDLSIRHQPFIITLSQEGWYWANTGGGGPNTEASIEDVLHLMMHCDKHECVPLIA